MRTQHRKTRKRRRRRRFYKRRRGTRRRRRRRGRMTRGRRRGGSKMAEAEAVGRLAKSVKSGKTSKVDGAKELFSIVGSGKGGKKGSGKSNQLPITVLCDSADVVADAACEIVGLGPEDPLADVCAYEMLTHVAKWCKNFVSKHEPSALKRILNNPLNIVKVLAGKKRGSSVLSSMAVKSGHMGVEV